LERGNITHPDHLPKPRRLGGRGYYDKSPMAHIGAKTPQCSFFGPIARAAKPLHPYGVLTEKA